METKETPINQQIAALEAEIKRWDVERAALNDTIFALAEKRDMWVKDQMARKDRLAGLYQQAINAAQ